MSNTILRQVVSGDDAKQQLLHGINKSCDIIEVQLAIEVRMFF
jgi:hypothetical protein